MNVVLSVRLVIQVHQDLADPLVHKETKEIEVLKESVEKDLKDFEVFQV